MQSGNQNFYSQPVASSGADAQIPQRLAVIDQLLAATSNAFARQALHFRVAQAAPVSKDGKLVPLERSLCKHIQGDKRNPAHGRSSLLANNT